MSIKVLVVDDSSFMRSMLTRMITKDDRFEIVGQAKNGKEAVEMNASLKPDLITLDIEMPEMDGLTALSHIMKESPTRVVMVSSLTMEGAEATFEALEKGAVDFIPKSMEGGGKNILHASGLLIDKLIAASQVSVRGKILPRTIPTKPLPKKVVEEQASTSAPAATARPSLVERALQRKEAERAGSTTEKAPAKRLISAQRLPNVQLVVLGSSTGGPRALQEFLPYLPSSIRVPVVIAQHMPGTFTGPMADRLNSTSLTSVKEAEDGDVLQNGTVYIAPGGVHTRVVKNAEGKLSIKIQEDTGNEGVYKPSVDLLADSAADATGANTLAVMLTGMGADGSKGFAKLKQKGAYILAQDEETSVVYGMPKAVAPVADEILPLEEIAPTVKKLLS